MPAHRPRTPTDVLTAPAALPEPPVAARIVPVLRLAQGGRWRVEAMRAISEPCLLWFTRGQGRVTLGGVTRGYSAHTAIFVPAGVMHGFEIGPQTMGFAVFFGATQPHGDTMPPQANGLADTPRPTEGLLPGQPLLLRIREASSQAELSAIIEAASRELDSPRAGAARAAQLHLGLLAVWLERQALVLSNDVEPGGGARRLVTRFSTLLEREFRSGHSVAQYAADLGVTATHLSRSCRATSGRSALELLQDRRLYEARRLLLETRAPVHEISAALGFTSAAYFTRAFHARIGKTPSDFRRMPS